MTDTTTATATGAVSRPSWLSHPIRAWRALLAAQAERADAEAAAAGLTVQVLPNGVRRYRDPRLDRLIAHRAGSGPYRGVRTGEHTDGSWSAATLVVAAGALADGSGQARRGTSCRARTPDVGVLDAGPASPATRMTVGAARLLPSSAGSQATPAKPITLPHLASECGPGRDPRKGAPLRSASHVTGYAGPCPPPA